MDEQKLELFYINNKPSHAFLTKEFVEEKKLNVIYGPSNIKWTKEVNFKEPLEYLSTKSKKKILKALEYSETELHFSYEYKKKIEEKDFLEWLEIYNKNINAKEVSLIRINKEWFEDTEKVGKYAFILARNQNKEIIGGILVNQKEDSMSCGYRAHEHIHIKDSSLASILEYHIDKFALENKYPLITRGTDTNLYGVRLGIGLHNFKSYFNFKPNALDNSSFYYPRYLIFLNNYENVLTYIYRENKEGNDIEPTYLNSEQIKKFTYKLTDLI